MLPAIYLPGLGRSRYLPARIRVKRVNRPRLWLCSLLLHRHAGFKALLIAVNRGNRQNPAVALVADDTVALRHVTLDVDAVPLFRVANIVDRHIIVLAPEERRRTEGRRHAYHVESRDLSLALGDHPVLDTDAFA